MISTNVELLEGGRTASVIIVMFSVEFKVTCVLGVGFIGGRNFLPIGAHCTDEFESENCTINIIVWPSFCFYLVAICLVVSESLLTNVSSTICRN